MPGKVNAKLFLGGLIMSSIKQLLCFVYSCPFFPLLFHPPFFKKLKEHLKTYNVKKGHGLRNRLREIYWPSLAGLGKSSHHRKEMLPGAARAEVWAQQRGLGVSTFSAFC